MKQTNPPPPISNLYKIINELSQACLADNKKSILSLIKDCTPTDLNDHSHAFDSLISNIYCQAISWNDNGAVKYIAKKLGFPKSSCGHFFQVLNDKPNTAPILEILIPYMNIKNIGLSLYWSALEERKDLLDVTLKHEFDFKNASKNEKRDLKKIKSTALKNIIMHKNNSMLKTIVPHIENLNGHQGYQALSMAISYNNQVAIDMFLNICNVDKFMEISGGFNSFTENPQSQESALGAGYFLEKYNAIKTRQTLKSNIKSVKNKSLARKI